MIMLLNNIESKLLLLMFTYPFCKIWIKNIISKELKNSIFTN